jgi:hypothetical protein
MPPVKYFEVREKPALFLSMTSLTVGEFDALVTLFGKVWARNHQQDEKKRGRPPEIKTNEERLFFVLFYHKTYPLQEVLGYFFGISQERACELVSEYTQILKITIAEAGEAPARLPETLKKILETIQARTISLMEPSDVFSGQGITKHREDSTVGKNGRIQSKIISLLTQKHEKSNT